MEGRRGDDDLTVTVTVTDDVTVSQGQSQMLQNDDSQQRINSGGITAQGRHRHGGSGSNTDLSRPRPQARPNLDPMAPSHDAEYSYHCYSTQPLLYNSNYFSISPETVSNSDTPSPWSCEWQEEFEMIPHHDYSASQSTRELQEGFVVVPHDHSASQSTISQAAVSSSELQEGFVVIPAASSVSVPSHTAASTSHSHITNPGAVAPARGTSHSHSHSQQVWLPVHESNLNRNQQVRAQMRVRHPEADERQLDILVERELEEIMIRRRRVDRHADMRLDTDHTSHEELVANEERMGYVNTGVGEEIVNGRWIQGTFSALSEIGSETCCICLNKYVEGDEIGRLDCGHKFHSECIKKWLAQKNTCPMCEKARHWSQTK